MLTVVVGGMLLAGLKVQIEPSLGLKPQLTSGSPGVIKLRPGHETEFLRVTLPPEATVNMDAKVFFSVLFDHPAIPGNVVVVETLKRLARLTRSIVDRFAAEFFCK
jgi:hypothetical protein